MPRPRATSHLSAAHPLLKGLACLLMLVGTSIVAHAQDRPAFIPPQAHAWERYAASMRKNPFTLKTAPAAVPQESFAKDLTLASIYGDITSPTVVLVNTRTQKRFRLRAGQPAAGGGMSLKHVTKGISLRDSAVEVTLGTETAEIHSDGDFLRQLATAAASQSAQRAAIQRQQSQIAPPSATPHPLAITTPANSASPVFLAASGAPPRRLQPPNDPSPPQSASALDPSSPETTSTDPALPSSGASDDSAYTPPLVAQLESAGPIPLRRLLLRSREALSHPDPQ